jgi:hypothetical protein
MMAIVLLAVVLLVLAGLSFQTAQRSVTLADSSARQALLLQEVNRLSVVPYASIPAQVGCDSVFSGASRLHRCVTVANLPDNARRVTVVMRSRRQPNRSDSVSFVRARPPVGNPLNM